MANDGDKGNQPGNKGKDGANRKRGRRYFRRKKSSGDGAPSTPGKSSAPSTPEAAAPRTSEEDSRRKARRNRRRRNKSESPAREKAGSIIAEIEHDYVPPTSVFVHTHVIRPHDLRDGYEYRSEHFSGGVRTVEDFQIDLTPLLTPRPKMVFNFAWDEAEEEFTDSPATGETIRNDDADGEPMDGLDQP